MHSSPFLASASPSSFAPIATFLALLLTATSRLDAAAPTTAATTPAPPPRPTLADLFGSYDLSAAHLDAPFWRSKAVPGGPLLLVQHGESVLFVQEDDAPAPDGTLLFNPYSVLRVRNARTGVVYESTRDFFIEEPRLVLTKDSRIPFLRRRDLYKRPNEKRAIKEKAGDPATWLLFAEHGFAEQQVEVDYQHADDWGGYVPSFAGASLPRVLARLQAKQELRLAVTGDSISAGANASARGYPPHQPAYPALFARGLEHAYGSKVELLNVSVGGAMANGALTSLPRVTAFRPDLVIIAYGMNDVAARNAAQYAQNIKAIMDGIRAQAPDAEFILIATSRANPEWSWTPPPEFPKYRDALAALAGPHVALLDLTALWSQMLARKRYHDLTGNGVNHPNDFGHRVYAQALLGLLVK